VIGWFLVGIWITQLRIKVRELEEQILDIEHE
jgi:hypothetical protein